MVAKFLAITSRSPHRFDKLDSVSFNAYVASITHNHSYMLIYIFSKLSFVATLVQQTSFVPDLNCST